MNNFLTSDRDGYVTKTRSIQLGNLLFEATDDGIRMTTVETDSTHGSHTVIRSTVSDSHGNRITVEHFDFKQPPSHDAIVNRPVKKRRWWQLW